MMMRESQRLKALLHRSLERIINKPIFQILWDESTDKHRATAVLYLKEGLKSGLLDWIKNHPSLSHADRNTGRLKEIARKLRIKNWSRLSKLELLKAIEQKEELDNEKSGYGDRDARNDKRDAVPSGESRSAG